MNVPTLSICDWHDRFINSYLPSHESSVLSILLSYPVYAYIIKAPRNCDFS